MPDVYSSTPGGTLYSTTPGGNYLIVKDRILSCFVESSLVHSSKELNCDVVSVGKKNAATKEDARVCVFLDEVVYIDVFLGICIEPAAFHFNRICSSASIQRTSSIKPWSSLN